MRAVRISLCLLAVVALIAAWPCLCAASDVPVPPAPAVTPSELPRESEPVKPAEPAPPPPTPAPPPSPTSTGAHSQPSLQRIILYIDRTTSIKGSIEEEDENVIVVRELGGRLQSMPKARVLEIVRLVEPRPGQTGTVVLRNGDRQRGVIVEDAFDYVMLEIEGVRAKLMREVVDRVILEPGFDERLRQFREALLRDYSPQRHFELCRWLFDQRQYELARQELEELVGKSKLPQAVELLRIVKAQLALKPAPKPEVDPERPGGPSPPPTVQDEDDLLPTRVLSRDDVNIIRVYEIDFADPPKVAVQPETIRKLIENYGSNEAMPAGAEDRNALFRADPLQIVRLMFQLRARDLYPEIEVVSEPRSLNLFRQRVHSTWLITGCASTACHGGVNSGRFYLHRRNQRDERVRYANLLTLERFTPEDEQWPLIDYQDPMRSLIIQYGLPRADARKPHPPVKGWNPVFNKANRRMLDGTIEWISSMMQPRPQYPVEFEPQFPKVVEAPAPPAGQPESVPR